MQGLKGQCQVLRGSPMPSMASRNARVREISFPHLSAVILRAIPGRTLPPSLTTVTEFYTLCYRVAVNAALGPTGK